MARLEPVITGRWRSRERRRPPCLCWRRCPSPRVVFHEWFQMVGFLDQPEGVPSDPALRASARQQAPELPDGQLEDWIADFRRY